MPTIVLCLLPVALVWLRFPNEPSELVRLRYVRAFICAWCAFGALAEAQHDQVIAAAEARGDWETADRDTEAGAPVLLIGWVPAVLCVGLLGLYWHIGRAIAVSLTDSAKYTDVSRWAYSTTTSLAAASLARSVARSSMNGRARMAPAACSSSVRECWAQ